MEQDQPPRADTHEKNDVLHAAAAAAAATTTDHTAAVATTTTWWPKHSTGFSRVFAKIFGGGGSGEPPEKSSTVEQKKAATDFTPETTTMTLASIPHSFAEKDEKGPFTQPPQMKACLDDANGCVHEQQLQQQKQLPVDDETIINSNQVAEKSETEERETDTYTDAQKIASIIPEKQPRITQSSESAVIMETDSIHSTNSPKAAAEAAVTVHHPETNQDKPCGPSQTTPQRVKRTKIVKRKLPNASFTGSSVSSEPSLDEPPQKKKKKNRKKDESTANLTKRKSKLLKKMKLNNKPSKKTTKKSQSKSGKKKSESNQKSKSPPMLPHVVAQAIPSKPLTQDELMQLLDTKRQQIRTATELVVRALAKGPWPSRYLSLHPNEIQHRFQSAPDSNVQYTLHAEHMSVVGASLDQFAQDVLQPTLLEEIAHRAMVSSYSSSASLGEGAAATDHDLKPFYGTLLVLRDVLVQNAGYIFGNSAMLTGREQDFGSTLDGLDDDNLTEDEMILFSVQVLATTVILTALEDIGESSDELVAGFLDIAESYE